jgi:hypothetical protein
MVNWPAIATNLFDASGNFDSTNPVSPAEAQRFYRILVGGTIVLPPPGRRRKSPRNRRTSLCSPANRPSFFAAASGTAPLAYQWFFNPNTPLAGGDERHAQYCQCAGKQ